MQNIIFIILWVISGIFPVIQAQNPEATLIIEIEGKGTTKPVAAWLHIRAEGNDNIGGWYGDNGPVGFPAYSPVKVKVPAGMVTVSAWNSECDEVTTQITVDHDTPAICKLVLTPRFDLHNSGYFSFDSHDHLDGDTEKNCPPFIYPYCAAMGIDHLDVCQGWFHKFDSPVSYDSIANYLATFSTENLDLHFGVESPKLRYGHTWYVNHPGLADPFGDYLKWHDVDYFESQVSGEGATNEYKDLRIELHPKWRPPFVDRMLYCKAGAFAVAAHPARWWHHGRDEILPATNMAADLAFDLLAAQSYDGLAVMGDCRDNIFCQNIWFNILNLGYRLTPVAETDGNIANGSLGKMALTYAWTGGKRFDMMSLTENLKEGHTMMSGKAVMLLTVDGNLPPGSVLSADGKEHIVSVKVYSEPGVDEYVSWLVLYRNGKIFEKLDLRDQKIRNVKHDFVVRENGTAWYVVKSYGKNYPGNELQFDVMAYAKFCEQHTNTDYLKNTGVSITAPVYFNGPGWQSPDPLISHIHGKVLNKDGKPLANAAVEIWNIDKKLAALTTDAKGKFEINAPATIDVRFTLPGGQKEQQWLFYEYPPLLDLMEDTYTVSWEKKYPGISGSQVPWEAFHYNAIRKILKEIHWNIVPNGKIMMPGRIE